MEVFMRDYLMKLENGVATMKETYTNEVAEFCKQLYVAFKSDGLKNWLLYHFPKQPLEKVYLQLNGINIEFQYKQLKEETSAMFIYLKWLKCYFDHSATEEAISNVHCCSQKDINSWSLKLKRMPDDKLIYAFTPKQLFYISLIARLYQGEYSKVSVKWLKEDLESLISSFKKAEFPLDLILQEIKPFLAA